MSKELFWDKTYKLLLILGMMAPFFIYNYLEYQTAYYAGDVITDTKIYGGQGLSIMPFLLAIFSMSLYLFVQTLKESAHNTLKIEKAASLFFKEKFKLKTGSWAFYLVVVALFGVVYAAIVDSIVLTANHVRLYSEYNAITLEKNAYFGHAFDMAYFFGFLIITLTLLAIALRPNEVNYKFFFGFLVIPFFISNIFSYSPMDYLTENAATFNIAEQMTFISVAGITFKLALAAFFAIIVFVYFKNEFKKYKKSLVQAIKDLKFVVIGYLMTAFSALILASYLFFSPSIKHFNEDPNILTVKVYDQEFVINQTLLSVQQSSDTEYLIESFVGLSMHNAMPPLEYLLSEEYSGDNEKAIKFVADLLLINLEHQEKRLDKVVDILKNERISLSTSMNFLIQVVIYEATPLHHQERSLKAIIDEDYQAAVDYYLEDALNRKDVEEIRYKQGEGETRTGSVGHPLLQGIISALLRNNLATLNYDDIHDKEVREKIKKRIEGFNSSSSDPISDELIEEWFNLFKVDRLNK